MEANGGKSRQKQAKAGKISKSRQMEGDVMKFE
jgi:hypothetical protein